MKTMGKVKRTIKCSNGLDGKTVNQDENVCSVGNVNATVEYKGKSEKNGTDCSNLNARHVKNGKTKVIEFKECSNGSDGKPVRESGTSNMLKIMSIKDKIVHSVDNLNAADRNNGKGKYETKECSKHSEKKTVERQSMIVIGKLSNTTSPKYERVDSVDNLNATDDSIGKDQKKSSKACSNGSD